ncbi:MAG TPA: GMC family oxidoreductase [Candidatus Limnocylindria bacterium]|nr:GMC family oxidoreductase [Candidatus Limnocylindria bacterium]
MRVDASSIPSGSRLEFDLCIVGSGAAGITLARRFASTSIKVVVLESGLDEYDPRTQALAEGEIVGLPYFPLDTARLRWLGGTTNHWGGHCRPMAAEDLEARSWVPNSGWPIGLQDLEPYYERARIECRVPSKLWTLEAWQEKDSHKPLPLVGQRFVTRIAQLVGRESRSFRVAHRSELASIANVAVHLGANVTEIETSENGTLVTRVHVATLGGQRYSVTARQIVLAAGGIENPRLLLASNRQWPAGLGNQNDVVGRFFLEHPRFTAGYLAPSNPHLRVGLYDDHSVGKAKLQGYLSLSKEAQRAEQLVGVEMLFRPTYVGSFEQALESNDVRELQAVMNAVRGRGGLGDFGRHLANVVADLASWQSILIPGAPLPVPFPEVVGRVMRSTPVEAQALIPELMGDIVAGAYAKTRGAPIKEVRIRTRIDPAPNPDSRVTLSDERDELGMPRVRLDWRLTALDHHSVRRTMEIFGAEIGRAGLGRVRITFDEGGRTWPEDLAGGYHHIGTTRMSDDAKHGVVDRNGRVHGIENLFIAGSSVFPTAGSGPPTITIVALAMRLADHLKGRLA